MTHLGQTDASASKQVRFDRLARPIERLIKVINPSFSYFWCVGSGLGSLIELLEKNPSLLSDVVGEPSSSTQARHAAARMFTFVG